ACRLSASPQLRAVGTIGGNLLQATRCWYWRLKFPCRLHGGDRCHAREGEHREHAIFANDFCASAHPSDPAAALLALGATVRTDALQLELAPVLELDARAGDEVVRRRAHEHLVRTGRRCDARADVHGDAPRGAAARPLNLTRMNAGADAQPERRDCVTDRKGA